MLVGNPSSGKSPALSAARRVLQCIEKLLRRQNEKALLTYKGDKLAHNMAKHMRKTTPRSKLDSLPAVPDVPENPPHLQLVIGNATIESTAKALGANPRGLLSFHDELASLLLNLARYSNGSDRPLYLEAWAAAPWIINRMSYERPLEIPSASLSMIGGIQPEKLQEFLAKDPDDGLAARFLYAYPDPAPRIPLYQRAVPDDSAMSTAMLRLWQIPTLPTLPLRLSIDLRDFDPHHERLHALQAHQSGYLAGFVGKGNGTIIRLAGILTLLEWATGPSEIPPPSVVSKAALAGAAELWNDYLLPHARACLRPGQKPGSEQNLRRVLQYLRDHNITHIGRSDIREKVLGRTLPANEVTPILKELVRRGWLRQLPRPVNGPGRPSDSWEVNPKLHLQSP
jgi:putative DNA primase/helicase